MLDELELVLDAKAVLGEGPCWDFRNNILYWVDIEGKKVHMYNHISGKHKQIQLEREVSAIIPCIKKDTEFIVTLDNGFHILNIETEQLKFIGDPERDLEHNRFNDGKCDAYGRLWAGTMCRDGKKKDAALYCLDNEGKWTEKISHLSISNGMAWTSNNEYLYHIDTPAQTVTRYEYDVEAGDLGKAKQIIDFSKEEGFPDGMTIDSQGMLWIAHYGGGRVSRWNPESGEKLREILLPAPNVTSCTFGGKKLNELYITTARSGLDEEKLKQYPQSGGLYKVKLDITGVKTYLYQH
ncbi:SMP-30/gluconolactonase/LRE family protein [Niallia sp. FSL W8-0635]|uniref:SMP-30/gluconolactonase/LRE family protein n=1 Tax=Niallia sp. FSL W8-0635 TaxID=2975337 RepID=UPI0009CE7764|nr:SMP-30/gluconolaconase/LRE domain-containing protein [Mycobacteroides abscessus subsp. abscessus]HEO8420138.1 SMP-30/gluconolactonase/LRE family protein [Yersinia enterocolitica]